MDYQENLYEKRAQADINKLKESYVIDLITANRVKEILIYLYLSQGSRNQRGINIQTEKLKDALHNCPKIITPVFSARAAKAAACHA